MGIRIITIQYSLTELSPQALKYGFFVIIFVCFSQPYDNC